MNCRLKPLRRVAGETALQIPHVKQPLSSALGEGHSLFPIFSAGLGARNWLQAELLGKAWRASTAD